MEIHQQNQKKAIPKVDLTAMVDLGFLLITFFMLATSFVKPKVMEVFKPASGDSFPYPQSKTATILLGKNNSIYSYSLPDYGIQHSDIVYDTLDYSETGLRTFIQKRQSEVAHEWGDGDKLMMIIKPMPNSTYKNLIDVMDEIMITGVKHYAISDDFNMVDSMIMKRLEN